MKSYKHYLKVLMMTLVMVLVPMAVFAGSADDSVTVRVTAGYPGHYYMADQELTVAGNTFEKAYPELGQYDLKKGVSVGDVLVAAHMAKYGNLDGLEVSWDEMINQKDGILVDRRDIINVDKSFGNERSGWFFVNDQDVFIDTINTLDVKNGDRIFFGAFEDANYNAMYAFFEQTDYDAIIDQNLSMTVRANNYDNDKLYTPKAASVSVVDPATGEQTPIDSTYEDGRITVHFQPATAEVKVTASMPGTYYMVNQDITAASDMVEKNYPKLAQYEPKGQVSVADVLVAAHLAKYGNLDGLNIEYNDYYKSVSMVEMFGNPIVGYYYYNNGSVWDAINAKTVTDGDRIYFGAYEDNSYNSMYSYFTEDAYTATAGKTLELSVKADNWGAVVNPDEATVNVVDPKTGALTPLATTYKDGVASVTFDKAGTYTIALSGVVSSEYGDQKLTGATAQVKVNAAPVVKTVAKPKTPGHFTVKKVRGQKKYNLKWSKVSGVKSKSKGYQVQYRKKGGSWHTMKKGKWTASTKYRTQKLAKKKTYQFRVRAYKVVNGKRYNSAWSKTVTKKLR